MAFTTGDQICTATQIDSLGSALGQFHALRLAQAWTRFQRLRWCCHTLQTPLLFTLCFLDDGTFTSGLHAGDKNLDRLFDHDFERAQREHDYLGDIELRLSS